MSWKKARESSSSSDSWLRLAADFLDAAFLFALGLTIAWPARGLSEALGSKGVLIGLPIAFLLTPGFRTAP